MTMRLTKLEHACMMLERGAERLLIDPGKFTTPLTERAHVVGIVITHEHDDHWTREQLARVIEQSPDAAIFAPAPVLEALRSAHVAPDASLVEAVPGDRHECGPFALRFHGGTHAEIHSSIPRVPNVGVLVNEAFYYGGDAYDAPEDVRIDTLAVPAYGPWMRIADSIDYILRVRPRNVVPVHEMLLARAGKELASARLKAAVHEVGGRLLDLQPYAHVDIRDAALPSEGGSTASLADQDEPESPAAVIDPDAS